MTINEFNQLHEIEKEELILDEGFFVSESYNEGTMYDTYQLQTFFVQLSYKINDTGRLSIEVISNPAQLTEH